LLARYISEEDDDLAVEMHEPSTYLNGLTIRDLEDLVADIRVYTDLEAQQGSNSKYDQQYWSDITIITEDELRKLRKLSSFYNDQYGGDRREGINQAVYSDVIDQFSNKTHQQLQELELRIKTKIETEKGIDIGYWESLLSQLQAHMARARLKDRHQQSLRKKLQQIKQEQGIPSTTSIPKTIFPVVVQPKESPRSEKQEQHSGDEDENEMEAEEEKEMEEIDEYESGRYSPPLFTQHDLDIDIQKKITDETDDTEKMRRQRESVLNSGSVKPDVEDAFEKFARDMGHLNSDDASINGVVPLDIQYLWSDKYRPRKPRFFNKVHTVNIYFE